MTVYVTTTDKFMSGWGMAKDRINKLILVCDSMEQARIVAENAENRSDQKHVNICLNPPNYYRKTFGSDYELGQYYVQIKTAEDMPRWYEQGAF